MSEHDVMSNVLLHIVWSQSYCRHDVHLFNNMTNFNFFRLTQKKKHVWVFSLNFLSFYKKYGVRKRTNETSQINILYLL
jgi:hypothetical protein